MSTCCNNNCNCGSNCPTCSCPEGERGPRGFKGEPGLDGDIGAAGVSGTTILAAYNSATGEGNLSATGPDVLFTYSMAANTLVNDGDELELFVYIEYTGIELVNLEVNLDATNFFSFPIQNSEDDRRFLKIKIARINQTSQLWTVEILRRNLTALTNVVDTINFKTTIFDLATPTSFQIIADNAVLGANQVVLKKAVLYKSAII